MNNKHASYEHVRSILRGYQQWQRIEETSEFQLLSNNQKDNLYLKCKDAAQYYHEIRGLSREESLLGDAVIPFWPIYQALIYKTAGYQARKTKRGLDQLLFQLTTSRVTTYSKRIKMVSKNLEDFAKLYYTPGNFMLLPDRSMSFWRLKHTQGRIDQTLFECFRDGELMEFFDDDEHFKEWIVDQDLTTVFKEGQMAKDNIDWFANSERSLSQLGLDEIWRYVERAKTLIEMRGSM